MKYCNAHATLTRTSASSISQLKAGTQRPLCCKACSPVFVRRAEGFSSLKNRNVAGFKTTPVPLASRLLLCNRAVTGTRTQAMARRKTLEPDFYPGSLIRLPDELCAAIDSESKSSGRSRHFVLLTKMSIHDLQMYSDGTVREWLPNIKTTSTVKLTEEQLDSLSKFMDCPLYVYLYSACIPALWKSVNQKSSALLPCWASQNTGWSIAWDVVEEYTSHNAKAAFNRFIWNLAKLKTKSFPYKKFSVDPLDNQDEQQGQKLISSNELLTDSFLNMTVLEDEGIDSSEDAEKCRQYLNSCTSEVWKQLHLESMFQTSDEEGRKSFYQRYMMQIWHQHKYENEEYESFLSHWQLEDYGVSLSLAPWLVLLLCMPKYVANAVHYTMALNWKEAFSIGREIPTSSLATTLKQWEDPSFDLAKMAVYGNSVLCIMSMLSKFPSYEEVCKDLTRRPDLYKVARDTDDDHTSERKNQLNAIEDIVWSTMSLYKNHLFAHRWFKDLKEVKSDSSGRTEPVKIDKNLSERDFWNNGAFINNAFVAFVGHYYLQHGVGAVWKICKEFGIVEADPDSGFFSYSEEWKEKDPKKIPYKEQSQELTLNSGSESNGHEKIFNDFATRLGYTFRSESFFELGIEIWTSQDLRDKKFLEWYGFLGRVFIHQFFQSFMMQNHPELSQREINQIICDKVKTHLYIRLAFITDLPLQKLGYISYHPFSVYQDPEACTLYSFKDASLQDIKSIRNVEEHICESMLAILGIIIFDSGCSIPKFNKLIEPLLEKDINGIVANDGEIPEVTTSIH